MTMQRQDGPLVVVGINPPIGTTTPTFTGPSPYVSGVNENPDAAPSPVFGGLLLRDFRIRSRPDGAGLLVGGYANQDFGFGDNCVLTVDLVPALAATANIAALHALTINTPIPLVTSSGAGVTVLAAPFTVPGTLNVIPAGAVQIDAAPTYTGFGTSGAVQGWNAAACDRAVSLTSGSNLSGITITISGFDVFGYPRTQTRVGPNANTVNTLKGFKWISSVTPGASNAGTMSVGTADIFALPIRADYLSDLMAWWAGTMDTGISGSTGTFVAAVTTSPNTAALGDVRGTYAPVSASDGTKRLTIRQFVRPANAGTQVGTFGVTSA